MCIRDRAQLLPAPAHLPEGKGRFGQDLRSGKGRVIGFQHSIATVSYTHLMPSPEPSAAAEPVSMEPVRTLSLIHIGSRVKLSLPNRVLY